MCKHKQKHFISVPFKTERMYPEYVKAMNDLASPHFVVSSHVVLNWLAKFSLSKASITSSLKRAAVVEGYI